MRTIKFLAAIFFSIAIAACGGGGGGGAAPPPAADTTPPTVSSVTPANTSVGFAVNSAITATFSEALTASTVNTTTFTIAGVPGTVSYSGTTATFTPTAPLAYATLYTATITTGVKDLAGNAMVTSYQWAFTTGAAPDTTPPTVSSTSPANNATGVGTTSAITVTFSEPITTTTINPTTITLAASGVAVAGTVSYSGTTATFIPTASLASGAPCTATITTGVKDLAGNAMVANYTWTFTTGVADIIPPTVSSMTPASGVTGVTVNSAINATFSEPMLVSTISGSTFTLISGAIIINGNITYSGTTATFTPWANLANSTLYTATITTGVKDLAGNAMLANYTWTFTTGAAPDTIPPTISSTSPLSNATGVSPTGVGQTSAITATFSEPVMGVSTATFTLASGASSVPGTVTYNGTTATFSTTLANSTTYTATITGGAAGVKDLAGNALATNYTWSFTTGIVPDTTPPTVMSVTPASGVAGVPVFDGTSGIAVKTPITATFSKPMDATTISTATFTLSASGVPSVAGAVTFNGTTTATFTPSTYLAYSTLYTAMIVSGNTGVKDLAGNAMVANYTWTFTTAPPPTITAISAGRLHTVALKSDGTLWTWGYNTDGELGIGTKGSGSGKAIPTLVKNSLGQVETNWSAISAGGYHTLALKTNGTLWAWGNNSNGQIGDGTSTSAYNRVFPTQELTKATNWTAIAGGVFHSVALKADGTLWAWGHNASGQIGDNTTTDKTVPTHIGSATNWSAIAAGGDHTVAIQGGAIGTPLGTLWAWGKNFNGQLGDNTNVDKHIPTQIGTATAWSAIAAGGYHSVGLQGGTLYAWGGNLNSQVGDGTIVDKLVPTQIGAITTWSTISAGYQHTTALTGGALYTWGYNGNGQLGNGSDGAGTSLQNVASPTQIGAATTWSAIAAGDTHTKALRTDTTLWSWGYNVDGQMGNNTTGADVPAPTPISY